MKKLKMFVPALMVAFSLVAAMTASIAWFSSTVSFQDENPLLGETEGAYFAYGKGTAKEPFGINHPRHLYNLAWLQNLGYINDGTVGAGKNEPTYFKLASDVDMSQFSAIPPIGTKEHPFIGYFDGNDKTITGLKISNNYGDFSTKPTAVTETKFASMQPHIIGMFGVVGTYPDNDKETSSYSSQVSAVHDFTIKSATIASKTDTTLIGVLAGYLNGPVSNVGIEASDVDVSTQVTSKFDNSITSNVSDYAVVGYCTDGYKDKVNHSVTTLYRPATPQSGEYIANEDGDNQGWGGSIDMKTMYNGLLNIWTTMTNAGDSYKYTYYDTRNINETYEGEITSEIDTSSISYNSFKYDEGGGVWTGSGTSNYNHSYYKYNQQSVGIDTAQYSYVIEPTNANDIKYMCLTGSKEVTVKNGRTVNHTFFDEIDCFYIKDVSTNNYLTRDGTSITNATSTANATLWSLDVYNHLCTFDSSDHTSSQSAYYLRNNSGTLQITTNENNATVWTTNNNRDYFYSLNNGTAYFISYNTGWSSLRTSTSTLQGYRITDGNGNYLSLANNGSITNQTSEANATIWSRDAYYNQYYARAGNGTIYYLRYNNGLTTTDSQYNATQFSQGTNTLYYRTGSRWSGYTYYYIYYNGSNWTYSNSSKTTYVNEYYTPSSTYNVQTNTASSSKKYTKESYKENATFQTQPTYFPLRQETTNDIPNGIPKDTNTGYVVSGSKYYGDPYGDIRVSRFDNTSLPNDLDIVYTYNGSFSLLTNDGVDQAAASSLKNYAKAKKTLGNVLSSDNYIYGLHFMNATIEHGGDKSAYVGKAIINGVTKSNYELPTDCIDFNLKEKGFITFFAGTYFVNTGNVNNSFFSLYQIQRDNNDAIVDIKRIKEVYVSSNASYSNIYKFSDNKYSYPYTFDSYGNKVRADNPKIAFDPYAYTNSLTNVDSTYSKKFDTAWIEVNNTIRNDDTYQKKAFYFEIPMNDGEYCLGSVEGGTGAYLMYLDIGANAEKVKRSAIYDVIKFSEQIQSYPKGVFIIAAGVTRSDVNSYCICIGSGYKGKIGLSRTAETVENDVVTKSVGIASQTGGNDSSLITLSYAKPGLVVTQDGNANTAYSLVGTAVETLIERATYIEYHPSNNTTTKLVVTRITIGNSSTTTVEGFIRQGDKWVEKNDLTLYYDSLYATQLDGVWNTDYSGKKVNPEDLDEYFDNLYLDEEHENSFNDYSDDARDAKKGTIVLQLGVNLSVGGGNIIVVLTPVTTVPNDSLKIHVLDGYDITIYYKDANGTYTAVTGEAVISILNETVKVLDEEGEELSVSLKFYIQSQLEDTLNDPIPITTVVPPSTSQQP